MSIRFHIDSKLGELAVQSSVQLPDTYGGLPAHGAYGYGEGVTEINSIINLKDIANRLYYSTPDCESSLVLMENKHELSYFSSDTYRNAVQSFQASSFFLWGSWDEGGLFITHAYDDIVFGCNYGIYEDTTDESDARYINLYRIDASISGRLGGGSIPWLAEVAIMTQDNSIGVPSFRIICNNNVSSTGSATLYRINDGTLGVAEYTQSFGHKLGECMNDPTYTNDWTITEPFTFTPVPCQPFNPWDKDGVYKVPMISMTIPSTMNHISGSWDAGLSFEPEDNGGDGEPSGTGGDYPTKNDPQQFSDPTGGEDLLSTGLIQMYAPTASEVMQFQSFLFGNSITDAIEKQIKRLTSNPYDYVIFLALCNFAPTNSQNYEVMSFCGQSSGISARKIDEQMLNLGPYKLNLPQNAEDFTDYNPFTKVKIYVPYIGYQDLNPDEVIGCQLELMYHIDLMTGSCVAELKSTRSKRGWMSVDNDVSNIYYNWQGNVYMMCPLSSNDFRGFFTSMTQFAMGAGSMLSGNVIGGLGAMTTAVMSSKSDVSKNVPNGANYGFISEQTPYIIIERPTRQMAGWDTYASFEGVPSNMARKIGDISGYLETDENTVWGNDLSYTFETTTITAFDEEIEEIKTLFNSGVYV
jgi:hypothetical protein